MAKATRIPTSLLGREGRLLSRGLVLAALGLASACEDDIVRTLPPPETQVDVLEQRSAALVDILWVVDNSGTMVDEQSALATNFDNFITGLTTCQGTGVANDVCDFASKTCAISGAPCNPPDYHIGVISTDVRTASDQGQLRQVGLCTPMAGATPSGGKYRYCLGTDADCAADASDPNSDPANTVCDMSQAVSYVSPTTEGAAAAFSRAVRVGTSGSGRETGIEAAALALGRSADRTTGNYLPVPAANAGFLRDGASLFVIFVSDEDDSSFGQPTYFYRAFETLKGAGNEGRVSISAIVGDPDSDGEGAGDPGGCRVVVNGQEVTNAPGTRYVALAMYSRGLSSELRVCDGARLGCPSGSACQSPVEDLPGVCVPSGACSDASQCGSFLCEDGLPCVVCGVNSGQCELPSNNFLSLLETNGIFGSICDPDYGAVLGALGFEAAGLSRKFEMTEVPDCNATVPCCAGSDEASCTTEATVCVKVDGEPLANDRATGWVYDSGSNAIFFDGSFVPPPGAEVLVSYQLHAAADRTICSDKLN